MPAAIACLSFDINSTCDQIMRMLAGNSISRIYIHTITYVCLGMTTPINQYNSDFSTCTFLH